MRRLTASAAFMSFCLLTACGGGGDSGGVQSTPTPPPPPSPPPAASYSSFSSLGSTKFDVAATELTASRRTDDPDSPHMESPKHVQFSGQYSAPNGVLTYDATTKTYTFDDSSFGPPARSDASCSGSGSAFDCYAKNSSDNFVTEKFKVYRSGTDAAPLKLTYTTFFSYSSEGLIYDKVNGAVQQNKLSYGVTGFITKPEDLPRTGSATYTTYTDVAELYMGGLRTMTGSSTFSANFAAGTVSTAISLRQDTLDPAIGDLGTFTGTGSINLSNSIFSGALTGNRYQGSFEGAFFGPGAREMGFTFLLTNSLGPLEQISGVVVGTH